MQDCFWTDKEVLLTGGSGSLGRALVQILKRKYKPHGIRVYSRDEFRQWEFANELKLLRLDKNVAFLIGNVRDEKRLIRAMRGIDIAIHCAAMKQIPTCNENPIEAVATNVLGAQNVVTAALSCGIDQVMNISTDKAVSPINIYGACKMVAEKLFIHSNIYFSTKFSCCRYGNILGSRGSIIPLLQEQVKNKGTITITHKDMTRFWMSLDNIAQFVLDRTAMMGGGEIFVPKMKSSKVTFLIDTLWPRIETKQIGIREGEKLHETLISIEESRHIIEHEKWYEITSSHQKLDYIKNRHDTFCYDSYNNPDLLTEKDLEQYKEK